MLFYGFLASIGLNVITLILVVLVIFKQRSSSKNLSMLGAKSAEGSLPHIINQSYDKIIALTDETEKLNQDYSKLFHHMDTTLQNVGLVRFDAFEEMGGNLSFCMALLNNQKDGLVLTSINGRNENRFYVKQIVNGISGDFPLTIEETEAIKKSLKPSRQMFSEQKKSQKSKKPTVSKKAAKTPKKKSN